MRIQRSGHFDMPLLIVGRRTCLSKMARENSDQEMRAEFYGSESLAKYIKVHGVPNSRLAFRAMVASGSSEDLDGEKGVALIACLGQVVFFRHPQQINIMDKGNGKLIALIAR